MQTSEALAQDKSLWVWGLALVLLSLLDWTLTVDSIYMGIAYEANPLMRKALEYPLWVSFLAKTVLVGVLASGLVYMGRHAHWLAVVLRATVGLYLLVVIYQCVGRVVVL
jgi:hypothetical protein